MFRARQCDLVRSLRVVPGVDDERADGLSDRCCVLAARGGRPLEGRKRLHEAPLGSDAS
jgi:hypothetical protein